MHWKNIFSAKADYVAGARHQIERFKSCEACICVGPHARMKKKRMKEMAQHTYDAMCTNDTLTKIDQRGLPTKLPARKSRDIRRKESKYIEDTPKILHTIKAIYYLRLRNARRYFKIFNKTGKFIARCLSLFLSPLLNLMLRLHPGKK